MTIFHRGYEEVPVWANAPVVRKPVHAMGEGAKQHARPKLTIDQLSCG